MESADEGPQAEATDDAGASADAVTQPAEDEDRGDVEAVSQAFYARELSLPEITRSRAQAGFSVSTVLAGGLIAAGILSQFSSLSLLVVIIGMVAVFLWLVTSILFLWAIAIPVKLSRKAGDRPAADFVKQVTDESQLISKTIRYRSAWAAAIAAVALVATFATFALAVSLPRPDPRNAAADVVLTENGLSLVSGACPRAIISTDPPTAIADVDPNALTADPISLRLGAGQCGGVSDESIDLPRQDVLAIVVHSACTLPGLDPIALAGNQTPGLDVFESSARPAVSFEATPTPSPTLSPTPPLISKQKKFYMPDCNGG